MLLSNCRNYCHIPISNKEKKKTGEGTVGKSCSRCERNFVQQSDLELIFRNFLVCLIFLWMKFLIQCELWNLSRQTLPLAASGELIRNMFLMDRPFRENSIYLNAFLQCTSKGSTRIKSSYKKKFIARILFIKTHQIVQGLKTMQVY